MHLVSQNVKRHKVRGENIKLIQRTFFQFFWLYNGAQLYLLCLADLSLLQELSQMGNLAGFYIVSTIKHSEWTVNLLVLWLAFSTNIILEMYTFTRFTLGGVYIYL